MKKLFQNTISLVILLSGLIFHSNAQNGIIRGKIKYGDELLPMIAVNIGNQTTITDYNGEFSVSLLPGNYTIIINHTGYNKIVHDVIIEPGNTQIVDLMMTPVGQLGEVVVLGSRSVIQRSNLSSPVPVDVFQAGSLLNTGRPGLSQMLNFSAPSFNASRELLNESVTLRGLNPDQVLILLNGTRHHNMAYINASEIRGQLGKGSVANDINSIPFSSIEKIEILRDGASAQYGSDAIAGVINIILKESVRKTSVQLHCGQYYRGDGENISLGINHGFVLNKKGQPPGRRGFLNLSTDLRFQNHTHRGGEYKGTVYKNHPLNATPEDSIAISLEDDSIINARNFDRNNVSNAGNAKFRSFGMVMNGGYPIGEKTELFWTATLNKRKNAILGGYVFPKNARRVNPDLFPDGLKPLPIQYSMDVSGIAGAKGETKNQWHWEYTSAYGNNAGDYQSENTNNASQYYALGKNAPVKFNTGTMIYRQLINNINFTKEFGARTGRVTLFNLGYGVEWRLENYQVKPGEEAAWQNYDSLRRKDYGVQNGLILEPDNAANETRNVLGAYIDMEAEFKDRVLVNLASRYEYYNDFGGNLAGKIAVRYKISETFSLRGSVSNGFRAPSLQQSFYGTTTNGATNFGGRLVPVKGGVFRNDSEVAKAFGIPPLQAEKSLNVSAGFTSTLFSRVSITADAYWIQITNRIVQSGSFNRRFNPFVDSILTLYSLDVDQPQFFANAINTRTRGIDVVTNGNWRIKKSNLVVMLGANFTQTRLFGEIKVAGNLKADSLNTNTLFGRLERTRVERGQPDHKIILSFHYKTGRFGLLLRNTRFGKTTIASFPFPNDPSFDESFSSKILTDIGINYSPASWLTINAGVNNVFNVYPDRITHYQNTGEGQFIYGMEASPFGFNGGYYFVNMSFNF